MTTLTCTIDMFTEKKVILKKNIAVNAVHMPCIIKF
jgi:hypothetical protein